MQPAREDTVIGDFGGAAIEHRGKRWRFFRNEGQFFVTAEGPDGELHDYAVRFTFGVDPLQQYLVAFPGGRMQALPFAWDTRAQRWFFLHPDRDIPPTDWLHWTRQAQNWNAMCADCHSTHVEKNYDPDSDSFRTTSSEIAVGCEACHGPGSKHAETQRPDALVTTTRALGGRELVERCATCHARRAQLADQGTPGAPLMDRYQPTLLVAGTFHADGQVLDEDFEYQSFVQSKMYAKGVGCRDCHDVHSGRLRAEGNALCTRCHDAGRFDSPAHHAHAQGTAAAACTSCHMAGKKYMVVHFRRDHSLRVPLPELSALIGAPSACGAAGCHETRGASWLAAAYARMYGDRKKHVHWGPLIAKGRAGAKGAEPGLASLATDPERPAIVRATAMDLLGSYAGDASRGALERGLGDPDPLVRAAAATRLRGPRSELLMERLSPLLRDPVRAVRGAAAARLAELGPVGAPPGYEAAVAEYIVSQRFASDMPSGNFHLANVYASRGDARRAETYYRRALAIDDQLHQAKANLALLLAQEGRTDEAEGLFRAVLASEPGLASVAFNLALLLAERGRVAEAEALLRRALADDPTLAPAAYNLAVLLAKKGDRAGAIPVLERLLEGHPEHENGALLLHDLRRTAGR